MPAAGWTRIVMRGSGPKVPHTVINMVGLACHSQRRRNQADDIKITVLARNENQVEWIGGLLVTHGDACAGVSVGAGRGDFLVGAVSINGRLLRKTGVVGRSQSQQYRGGMTAAITERGIVNVDRAPGPTA